mgnify:CR=1 FL=1
MRIVAMADTHGYHDDLVVPDGDVLIHAGDLSARGTLPELARVANWLRSLPHQHKIVIAGNHDFAFQTHPTEARALFQDLASGLIYLQDEMAVVEGVEIWGSPWQPWFHDWAFNLHRGPEIDAKWQLIPPNVDILVTHGPPHGFGDRIFNGDRVGCEDLARQLGRIKPREHLFGHIHEDNGEWQFNSTKCRNVTVSQCQLPCTVFDITPLP